MKQITFLAPSESVSRRKSTDLMRVAGSLCVSAQECCCCCC